MKLVLMSVAMMAMTGLTTVAHADGEAAKPLMGVGQGKTGCDFVPLPDPKSSCRAVSSEKVDGLGKVSFLVAGTIKTGFAYALQFELDGHLYISQPVLVQKVDGAAAMDVPTAASPHMKILGKKYAALEVVTKHSSTAAIGDKKTTKYTSYQYLFCKAGGSSGPVCYDRAYGSADNQCTASIADDGTLSHACPVAEHLAP